MVFPRCLGNRGFEVARDPQVHLLPLNLIHNTSLLVSEAFSFNTNVANRFIACNSKMLHFRAMKSRDEVQANLRLPADLRDKLKAAAQQNHRSMTAEVVARLEDSFYRETMTPEQAKQRIIAALDTLITEAEGSKR